MDSRFGRILVAAVVVAAASACEAGEKGEIEEETPGLAAQAEVDGETARTTALARVVGGEIVGAELEQEDGRLVYSFDIKVEGKAGIEEILVDAVSGDIISQEHESDAREAAEADDENEAGEAADALARVPGGRIVAAELEEEDGALIFSYDVRVEGQEGVEEVHVDALTGEVIAVEHEGEGL